jgi:lipopolysaccharide transport system permease protein
MVAWFIMVIVEKTASGVVISADKTLSLLARVIYLLRGFGLHLIELWSYRELLRNLVMRDLKVRYRNSVLGILWSLGNPILMMLVYTLVFTIMTSYSRAQNFPIFVLCGILPWNFFSASIIGAIRSIIDNAQLVKKVYFPRECLPVAVVAANMVNFLLALLVLFVLILLFQIRLTWWILLLPGVVVVQVIFIVGFALIMATANVFYRDTQVIMEVVMMAWFFMTPIFYPVDILPHNYHLWGMTFNVWRWVNILNPMASIIATYRVILYDGSPPDLYFFMRTLFTSLVILGIGSLIFYRYSRMFAEEV